MSDPVAAGGRDYTVTGSGYDPDGEVCADGEPVSLAQHPVLRDILTTGLACNDAELVRDEDGWRVTGDPTAWHKDKCDESFCQNGGRFAKKK